jgi:hypothetical protein
VIGHRLLLAHSVSGPQAVPISLFFRDFAHNAEWQRRCFVGKLRVYLRRRSFQRNLEGIAACSRSPCIARTGREL